eukprot:gene14948-10691_t
MIQVTNFEIDYAVYQEIMGNVHGSLQYVGAYGGLNNAAQRFELLGDPLIVFKRQQIVGSVGGVNG